MVLQKEGTNLFNYWRSQELGDVPALRAYRDSLSQMLGDSVLAAMIEQRREEQSNLGISTLPELFISKND